MRIGSLILVVFVLQKVTGQEFTPLPMELNQWEQLGGKAKYEISEGVITGTAVAKTPNSFLTTKTRYSDFILEYEVYLGNETNSGVQIRSNSIPAYSNGRVHGYQVEIDPSERAFSGGLYDEGRRGWLYPLSRNEKGRKAFKNDRWNKFRIEAIGNEINTWVNGVHCARLNDDLTAEGFIGLQVHSIHDESLVGTHIKWRNLRIATENLGNLQWDRDPDVPEISFLDNKLTSWEKRKGWRLLWDGSSSEGWVGAKSSTFPSDGWVISEGELTVLETDGGESTGPGDIITTELFSDFELVLDFKITEGANSGIKYFVDPTLNKGTGSAIGCEFQILDDNKHPDAKMGVSGNRTMASLYDLISAGNLNTDGRSKQFKGVGNWNRARIVSYQGQVEHWLNGELAVKYDRNSQMFEALVAYSKYKDWDDFGQFSEGHILLQDHGNKVSFKNIKIREF